ncbi:uncharacterized protein LOC128740049 isoform X2 [Sabethes cyaneus]|uniref:uncharacterized protein LOC128740049 isoform X2 n=1 Tax=Sabethes cyaneus TaxID=53552 RepID=UPI00237DCA99|nr:uncharacterized protein LOC128740049 isoform X2 [Sabethes cyaneus]
MINFLSRRLLPKVQSDAIEDDSHPVSNLISADLQKLQDGFLAYSVTKPPVEIIFQTFCPISINSIKLWPRLGNLRSTSFEIFAQNRKGNFDKIGFGESQETECFEFVETHMGTTRANAVSNLSKKQFILFPTMQHLITHCSIIKVVIQKTARCAPVLRKVEIWAEAANSNKQRVKSQVKAMWFGNTETKQNELTYDIMTIPMILPSGKVVDQRTIEQCNTAEQKWGRQPSDPFTGLLYTDRRKPMFNAPLKARIDQFLIKHSATNKYQHVPRTAGFKIQTSRERLTYPVAKRQKCLQPTVLNLSCSSLESAVLDVLATTTRYTLSDPISGETNTACHICMVRSDNIYRITLCNHLICRSCLNNKDKLSFMCTCGTKFESKFIEKYHR